MINKITLLMAMQDEANPIIQSLALKKNHSAIHPKLPMQCYQSMVGSIELTLMVSGVDHRYGVDNIGSEAATLMAYEAMTKFMPDLVVSAGTAGGFGGKGAHIGKVYVSDEHFVFHDRHVPLPGFDQSAVGKYPALQIGQLADHLDLTPGVISTGSSLEKSDKDIRVIDTHNAVAKEMEAAAIAWVAMLFETPMIALKSITNLVDEDNKSEEEFVANLSKASQCLHDKVIALLNYLQGKTIHQLA